MEMIIMMIRLFIAILVGVTIGIKAVDYIDAKIDDEELKEMMDEEFN